MRIISNFFYFSLTLLFFILNFAPYSHGIGNVDWVLLKENNEDYKISFNDYFIKALALSLKKVPSMNANWNNNGSVTEFNYVDISVAVATDNGLFTPVVKHACTKSLENISKEVKESAFIAGASGWQMFRFIELPLIKTQLRINIFFTIISLKGSKYLFCLKKL